MISHYILNCDCGYIPNTFYECNNCIEQYCKNCMKNNENICLFCYEQKKALNSVKVFLNKNYQILQILTPQIFKFHKYKDLLEELSFIIQTIENGNSIELNNNIYNYCMEPEEIYELINLYDYKLLDIMQNI